MWNEYLWIKISSSAKHMLNNSTNHFYSMMPLQCSYGKLLLLLTAMTLLIQWLINMRRNELVELVVCLKMPLLYP